MGYYLAIDIGETKGQLILGHLEENQLKLEEVYQFESLMNQVDTKGWELKHLFQEIKEGMKKCKEIGKLPILVGIDTRDAAIVLLDEENQVLGDVRVVHQKEEAMALINNLQEEHPEEAKLVKSILFLPDYLNYLLTGVKLCEYTTACCTGIIDPFAQSWDEELVKTLELPRECYPEIRRPGAVLGNLARAVTEELGYDCIIVLPATHATSSAYFAIPTSEQLRQDSDYKEVTLHSVEDDTAYSASAVGNLLVQLIISHELKDVQEARECVKNSFQLA